MINLRNIVIQGVRDAVPRGQNISKVFGECQRKDETPTEWLERLRRNLQMFSGTDLTSSVGEVLLKTQFVAKSWEDIQRKLEKIDNWQEKGLQELLRETQHIYMQRDEEKQKAQAKVLVAAVREAQKQERFQNGVSPTRYVGQWNKPSFHRKQYPDSQRNVPECFYCKMKGHFKKDCRRRLRDEKIFQAD